MAEVDQSRNALPSNGAEGTDAHIQAIPEATPTVASNAAVSTALADDPPQASTEVKPVDLPYARSAETPLREASPMTVDRHEPGSEPEPEPLTRTNSSSVPFSQPVISEAPSPSPAPAMATATSPPDTSPQRLPGIAYVEQQAWMDQASMNPPHERALNVTDALSYLDAVKVQFQDQPDVYNHFLDIMKDFKSQIIDTPGVIRRVSHLFRGHPTLIQGFNTFLPVGYRIECPQDSLDPNFITVTTPTGTMTQTTNNGPGGGGPMQWSTSLHENPHTPSSFLLHPGSASPLLLPQGLHVGRPSSRRSREPDDPSAHLSLVAGASGFQDGTTMEPAVQYVQKIKQRCDEQTYKQFLDILSSYHHKPDSVDEREVAAQVSRLFKDAPDLRSDFRIFMADEHGQLFDDPDENAGTAKVHDGKSRKRDNATPTVPQKRKRKDKDREREKERERDSGILKEKLGSRQSQSLQSVARTVHQSHLPPAPLPAPTPVPPLPRARSAPSRSADSLHFFDRVKRELDSRETHHEFLKLVNLFTQDAIDTGRLVQESRHFLSEELMRQWREILGWDELRERSWLDSEAGVAGIAQKAGGLQRPSRAVLNLRYGSYRKLPASEANVTCTGRDDMCRAVLNDEWVSHPTWSSDDSGFIAHKKNVYEEALHRSEEERHEYDFHIDAIMRTISVLEPINNKIMQLNPDERGNFKLKSNLGGTGKPVHLRLIKKIYGRDAGPEVMQAMQETPGLAIPVVFARLKQKEEEWKRAQREWNKVWREVDVRNYPKSLDCQGITFKAADRKALTAKAFLSQIEAAREEQMARRAALIDPLFARTRRRHQLEFPIEEQVVLQDGLKLVFGFLDRSQAQIAFADRKRIEAFLRSFVPLFFAWDPVAFNAAFTVVQENADSDGAGSEDGGSMVDENAEVSSVLSMASGSSKRSHKKGAGLSSGGDLRKKLLKSEQAKSTGRKTRAQEGSPSVSRLASPVPMEVDSAEEGRSEFGETSNEARRSCRRRIFFTNQVFYTLLRLLEVLYSRLSLFKHIGAKLALESAHTKPNQSSSVTNPEPASDETSHPLDRQENAEEFYGLMLESCEKLFDNELEQSTFEDQMRNIFGVKHAYKIFTIDKVIGTLIKQVQTVLSDPKSQDLLEILKRERTTVSPTTQDQMNNRRNAEKILGPDENLFRVDWLPESKTITIQLLGKDDTNFDDSEVLTERWQTYIDSFVQIENASQLPSSRLRLPFLRKNLSPGLDGSTPDIEAGGGLEIKVCLRTYRLFFVSGTHEHFWRRAETQELEKASEMFRARSLAQQRWLKDFEIDKRSLPRTPS